MILQGAAKALELYVKAFNATEVMRMPGPGGAVMHAEIQIGDSRVSRGHPHSPNHLTSVSYLLYVLSPAGDAL